MARSRNGGTRGLLGRLGRSVRAANRLTLAGPPVVLVAYWLAFVLTGSRATGSFYEAASQIIPVLLLVLAIEGRAFRWRGLDAVRSMVPGADEQRIRRAAAGQLPLDEALDAVVDAADALMRQLTAGLLLAGLLVGEVVALVPLLTGDGASASARPVMAAIVAGLAGVAYVAVTGSPFLPGPAEEEDAGQEGGRSAPGLSGTPGGPG